MRIIASIAAFAVLIFGSPAPAAAAGTMTIGNSASYVRDPVPRGARLTINTDRVVSLDDRPTTFIPWVQHAPGGLTVTATCTYPAGNMLLPISFVGPSGYGGSQINVYFPNDLGSEPFYRCANTGPSHIKVQPAGGGAPIEMDAATVLSHPGIFSAAGVPSGFHVDLSTGQSTLLADCAEKLPADPKVCRPRTEGEFARLVVLVTGAEWFVCGNQCGGSGLIFELAPVGGGYRRLTLVSLEPDSTGVEKATLALDAYTSAGVHQLRVRFEGQPVVPPPLTIELGQPS